MIVGHVSEELEAVISIGVLAPHGAAIVEAVLDTGFNGFLSLSPELIKSLNLEFAAPAQVTLGDGTTVTLSVYLGVVSLSGREVAVEILESSAGALVGMALLRGTELRASITPGGSVAISPLQ